MALDSVSASVDSLQLEAYDVYCALARRAAHLPLDTQGTEPNLGGILLYIGELDPRASASVIAANVAGCATLSATEDSATQKRAIRDGVMDFGVTSLDEALRILKNEIRKRATVAVCVGLAPSAVEREMLERGVIPDLVFAGSPDSQRLAAQFGFHSRELLVTPPDRDQAVLQWSVAEAPSRWMAKLDAIAIECLHSDPWARRWIRLSPRYCGRNSRTQRALCCGTESARKIVEEFGAAVHGGVIGAEVSAGLIIDGELNVFRLAPSGAA